MRSLKRFFRGPLFPLALALVAAFAGCAALAIFLPRLLAPVAVAERGFSFAVSLFVAAGHEIPEKKTALFLLLFLPWAGALLCLFLLEKEPAIPQNGGAVRGHGCLLDDAASLTARLSGMPLLFSEKISYFSDGAELKPKFLQDLRAAKERIYLEYYIIAPGSFWGEIAEILAEKAAAGADVRVVYDEFGCGLTLPANEAALLERRGIRTAVYPIRMLRGTGRRDHRKIAVFDDVAYTGGINLADEYVGEKIRFGHWKDTAVRVEGAEGFCALFLRTWGALRPSEKAEESPKTSGAVPYCLLSDEGKVRLFPQIFSLLAAHARTKLYFFTPYLSLGEEALSALSSAALRGVDVRVMIPHIPDKKPVFCLSRAFGRELMRRGIAVREYTAGFLHAKVAVSDGAFSLVSSYNLDFRSFYEQAECGVLARDPALAAETEGDFLSCWKQGTPLSEGKGLRRWGERLLMLLAPLT